MPIGSANAVGIGMSKLLGNDCQRCTRLHKLTGIGVPQTMKYKTLRQIGSSNRVFEQMSVTT